MANINSLNNLVDISTRENFKEISSKGGKASVKAYRLKKLWKLAKTWYNHNAILEAYERQLETKYNTIDIYNQELTIKEYNHLKALINRESKHWTILEELAGLCELEYSIDIDKYFKEQIQRENETYLYLCKLLGKGKHKR